MGVVFFSSQVLSLFGRIPFKLNDNIMFGIIAAGYIFSMLFMAVIPRKIIIVQRITLMIAFFTTFFALFPFGNEVVSLMFYAMGAGGKRDISRIRCADISKTFGDPLARKVRSELRQAGVKHGISCIFSPEERCQVKELDTIGTISYMPAAFGCHMAAAALDLLLQRI